MNAVEIAVKLAKQLEEIKTLIRVLKLVEDSKSAEEVKEKIKALISKN